MVELHTVLSLEKQFFKAGEGRGQLLEDASLPLLTDAFKGT